MNILIFGFGFIGRPLAEKCYETGDNIRAIKRHLTSDDIHLPIDLDTLNLTPDCFQAAWANYETWAILLPPSSLENYVETIHYLIEQAEQHGITHLIYASSTSVFGSQTGWLDETSDTQPETESARKIVRVEQRLQQSAIAHVDIIRLGGLYASNRHPINSLLANNQPISGANLPVNMVHRDRAVAGIFQAIHAPNGKRIRHFVESPHLSKRAFYQREAKLLGVPNLEFVNLNQSDNQNLGKVIVSQFDDFGFQAA